MSRREGHREREEGEKERERRRDSQPSLGPTPPPRALLGGARGRGTGQQAGAPAGTGAGRALPRALAPGQGRGRPAGLGRRRPGSRAPLESASARPERTRSFPSPGISPDARLRGPAEARQGAGITARFGRSRGPRPLREKDARARPAGAAAGLAALVVLLRNVHPRVFIDHGPRIDRRRSHEEEEMSNTPERVCPDPCSGPAVLVQIEEAVGLQQLFTSGDYLIPIIASNTPETVPFHSASLQRGCRASSAHPGPFQEFSTAPLAATAFERK